VEKKSQHMAKSKVICVAAEIEGYIKGEEQTNARPQGEVIIGNSRNKSQNTKQRGRTLEDGLRKKNSGETESKRGEAAFPSLFCLQQTHKGPRSGSPEGEPNAPANGGS